MSVLRWEGTATAVSSIAHGGQPLGTVTYLRREKFLLPDGRLEEIPVVSGNAVRGILRDVAADLWWSKVGSPQLTLPVVHALWSGGALAKSTGTPVSGTRLAELRRAVPVVSVFGAAGGGRIIDGCLQVGKLVPICAETAHLVPEHLHGPDPLPGMWDLTQVEYYSRFPDQHAAAADHGDSTADSDDGTPMRYGVETFLTGTRFHTWFTLTWPTSADTAFFTEVLERYTAAAHVGGMSRIGHGRLDFDLTAPATDGPAASWTLPDDITALRLLELLSWLD